jgi:hypothetical protein
MILTALMGVAWWQAARWPVMETFELAGQPPGRIGAAIRPPTHREIANRGLLASTVIIALWIGSGAAWNAVRSRMAA